jgi:hypothetical protein
MLAFDTYKNRVWTAGTTSPKADGSLPQGNSASRIAATKPETTLGELSAVPPRFSHGLEVVDCSQMRAFFVADRRCGWMRAERSWVEKDALDHPDRTRVDPHNGV